MTSERAFLEAYRDRLTHRVIGAAIEVHRILGPRLIESIYEEAFCVELGLQGIPFMRQAPLKLKYKGFAVGDGRLDLLVDDKVLVELKAVESIAPIHRAQLLSYMRAAEIGLGLIIDFNVSELRRGISRLIK